MVTDEDIFEAYYQCLKHKGSSPSTINYMLEHRQDLIRLVDEINSRTYYPSTSITFVVTKPKSARFLLLTSETGWFITS